MCQLFNSIGHQSDNKRIKKEKGRGGARPLLPLCQGALSKVSHHQYMYSAPQLQNEKWHYDNS